MWLYATAKKQFFGLTDLEHSVSDSDSLMDLFTMHQLLSLCCICWVFWSLC